AERVWATAGKSGIWDPDVPGLRDGLWTTIVPAARRGGRGIPPPPGRRPRPRARGGGARRRGSRASPWLRGRGAASPPPGRPAPGVLSPRPVNVPFPSHPRSTGTRLSHRVVRLPRRDRPFFPPAANYLPRLERARQLADAMIRSYHDTIMANVPPVRNQVKA